MTGSDIVTNVVDGFTTFLNGTGEGVSTFFEKIFTNGNGGMSVMAIVMLSMLGLGIATGIFRALLSKVSG